MDLLPELRDPLQHLVVVQEMEDHHSADPPAADVDPLPVGVEDNLRSGLVLHADQTQLQPVDLVVVGSQKLLYSNNPVMTVRMKSQALRG